MPGARRTCPGTSRPAATSGMTTVRTVSCCCTAPAARVHSLRHSSSRAQQLVSSLPAQPSCRTRRCLCRLASGDAEGCVVVWDVLAASRVARLEDVPAARELLRDYASRTGGAAEPLLPLPSAGGSGASGSAGNSAGGGSSSGSGGVTSLAWVMPGSDVLAVVVAPALLLLWDVGGALAAPAAASAAAAAASVPCPESRMLLSHATAAVTLLPLQVAPCCGSVSWARGLSCSAG